MSTSFNGSRSFAVVRQHCPGQSELPLVVQAGDAVGALLGRDRTAAAAPPESR